MKQNKIISILIAVFAVLLAAIVVVSAWMNRQKAAGEKEPGSEQQTAAETETPTEEDTAEPQTVAADEKHREEDSAFYQAVKALAEDSLDQPDEILARMVEAAEEGNADAQYFAGELYLQGIGTKPDTDKAAEYLGQAYDSGNKHAFAIYGKLCFLGDGVMQDYERAYEAFSSISEPAAEISCALGIMNIYGMGVRPDYEAARKYLDRAAAVGSAPAATARASIEGAVYERRPSEAEPDIVTKAVTVTDYGADSRGLAGLVDTVYGLLASRERYDRFDGELVHMAEMSPAMAAKVAIFGKDNWLFFQNNADGASYHDYVGDNAFSEKELTAIRNNLEAQKQKAEAAGAKFILLIYPNKEIVYHDRMPSYITRESTTTRTDRLVAYLRENSGIEVVYPKEQFMAQKDTFQLYYATDTHCNMLGCFVGLSELLKQEYGKAPVLDADSFDIHSREYAGDISVLIGREDRYATDTVYFLPGHKVAEDDKVDSSMILVGDSFSDFLSIESAYYFRNGVSHYMIMDYGYDYKKAYDDALSSGGADIVVWECAERNVERLK